MKDLNFTSRWKFWLFIGLLLCIFLGIFRGSFNEPISENLRGKTSYLNVELSSWSYPGENLYGNHVSLYQVKNTPLHNQWTTTGIGTAGGVPVVDNSLNLLYCPTVNGLSTLNLTDGHIVWSTDLPHRSSSPIYTSDGILYMLVNNCLHSTNARTGKFLWESCVSTPTAGFMNSPILSSFTKLIYFSVGTTLYSSNPLNGHIIRSKQFSLSDFMTILYYPIIDNEGKIYIHLSGPRAKETDIYQLSSSSEIIEWMTTLPCQSLSPLLWNNRYLYVGCGKRLFAFIPSILTTDKIWSYDFQKTIGLAAPVVRPSDQSIIVATTHSTLYALSDEGILLWTLQLEPTLSSTLSLAQHSLNTPIIDQNNKIYVTNAFGKLYVIDEKNQLLWTRGSIEQLWIFSHPVVTSTGGLIILESVNNTRGVSGGVVVSQYSVTLLEGM